MSDTVVVHPGKYCYTLGASSSIVETDYIKSAVLSRTAGDLLFVINTTATRWGFRIYVPPEFSPPCDWASGDTTNIWTSLTNDYKYINVTKQGDRDLKAPNWWRIDVYNTTNGGYSSQSGIQIRLFDMTAPAIAGRYHFKVFTLNTATSPLLAPYEWNWSAIGNSWANFPTLVVKGEIHPAYITGVIFQKTGYYYYSYTTHVIAEPGMVIATGKTPQGRLVEARAYLNQYANGYYQLLGLAPGTYNLTATASGYEPTTRYGITLQAGQSMHGINFFLDRGANITGTIYSKCREGTFTDWERVEYAYPGIGSTLSNRSVNVELIDGEGNLRAFLPYFGTFPYTEYDENYHQFSMNQAEYTGHVPLENATFVSGIMPDEYKLYAYVFGYVQTSTVNLKVTEHTLSASIIIDLYRSNGMKVTIHFRNDVMGPEAPVASTRVLVLEAIDYYGNLRAWNITEINGGDKNVLVNLNGMWSYIHPLSHYYFRGINDYGMPEGTYKIRAYMYGYWQSGDTLASTTLSCGSSTEFSFSLFKGGAFNITVRSIDWQSPPQLVDWKHPDNPVYVSFIDASGNSHGSPSVPQEFGKNNVTLYYDGEKLFDTDIYQYWQGDHDTSLPTGSYQLKANSYGYIRGYVPWIYLSTGISDLTLDLKQGGNITITLGFLTEELSSATKQDFPYRIELRDNGNLKAAAIGTIPSGQTTHTVNLYGLNSYVGGSATRYAGYYDTVDHTDYIDYGIDSGLHNVYVYVPTYIQKSFVVVLMDRNSGVEIGFSLEEMAHVHGTVHLRDISGSLLPFSWARVTLPTPDYTTSLDGAYEMWHTPLNGPITFNVPPYHEQFTEIKQSITLTWGSDTIWNAVMEPTGIAIPEFNFSLMFAITLLIVSMLMATRTKLNLKRPVF